jgi:hypothetical protein
MKFVTKKLSVLYGDGTEHAKGLDLNNLQIST